VNRRSLSRREWLKKAGLLGAAAPLGIPGTINLQEAQNPQQIEPREATAGLPARLGLQRMVLPARNIRGIDKSRMVHNNATPHIEVDPETYEVRADGVLLTCEPARTLPLAQRYFLF